jgi:hypothetical protein
MQGTEWGECTESCFRECKTQGKQGSVTSHQFPLAMRQPQGRLALNPKCVFPFTFKNVTHYQCTTVDSQWPWCATQVEPTAPWNVINNQWSDCDLISCNYAKRISPPELAEVRTIPE